MCLISQNMFFTTVKDQLERSAFFYPIRVRSQRERREQGIMIAFSPSPTDESGWDGDFYLHFHRRHIRKSAIPSRKAAERFGL